MDGHLKQALERLFALALLAAAPFAFAAEALPDPTRPPPEYFTGADASVTTTAGPTLQSVFISKTHRSAIINGQSVVVGDKVGNEQVVAIRDGEVVLRDGKELHSLKLFPNVAKAGTEKPGGPAKTGKKQ